MRLYTEYNIVPVASLASGDGPPETVEKQKNPIGNYVERLLSLIPGETVVVYPIALQALATGDHVWLGTSIAGVIAIAITILLRSLVLPAAQRPQWYAVLASVAACIIWIYQQRGYVFLQFPSSWAGVPTLALVIFVIFMPYLLQGDKVIVQPGATT
jgi:hypothetical protein